MSKPMIEVANLTCDYGHGRGVFDLSFTVYQGEVFGFLGPNGAGKTTTIRQLMGFVRPDRGSAKILGLDCFIQSAKIQSNVGYLPGELALMEDMSGEGFLKLIAGMKGLRDPSRMEELCNLFELNPHQRIRRMSKGTKQKLGLVCAFMGSPEILILDEPTSGLDPLMQNRFTQLLLKEKERGATILLSSHLFEETEKTCDRVAILRAGRLAAVEQMQKLRDSRTRSYTFVFPDEQLAQKALAQWGGKGQLEANSLSVTLDNAAGLPELLGIAAECKACDLREKNQTLEELFLHFYGEVQQDA